jgi:hypothetical protein
VNPPFSDEGYRRRLYAIEWHANLWRMYGTPRDVCERMIRACTENLDAENYGIPRPGTDDADIARMQAYLDALFKSESDGPCGPAKQYFA